MNSPTKKLTWLGHNCFIFQYGDAKFVVDPFVASEKYPIQPSQIAADHLLVSHGHSDHCKDALTVAKKNNATIVAIAEIAEDFSAKHPKVEPINVGGAVYLPISSDASVPKAQILAVQAPHSSTLPNGSCGGNALGFVLSFSQNGQSLAPANGVICPMKKTLSNAQAFSIYFACDTGYFAEMNWIGDLGIDVAVLPIGDRYTMGPALSLDAINAIRPKFVVPSHYNTWAPIAQDAQAWSHAVDEYTDAKPLVLKVGQTIEEKDVNTWN